MRPTTLVVVVLLLLFLNISASSQSRKMSIAPEPSWITCNNVDYTTTTLEHTAEDGYIDFVHEIQVSLADKCEYFRTGTKILSDAGVQNGSEISISFDPSYEQLIFHSIYILRDGEKINKLNLSKIKLLQQEKELNDFIYNGTLDAVLILDDVRKGDVIEYTYSLKGFNPIFQNRYSRSFLLGFSVPVIHVYYKIIVPHGRHLNVSTLHTNVQPSVSHQNGSTVYEWRGQNIEGADKQDYTPAWYDLYPKLLLSEFNSWQEVNQWAMQLFPAKTQLSSPVLKKIKEITSKYNTDEERVGAALRFVQDEIRYMGIESGINSHKPADPSKVFAQRFGDCKEKTYLLCQMFREMNIDASPVLINSYMKKGINNYLPAPTTFDHVTIRVKLKNQYYWFDPTISNQRGDIRTIYFPDYQMGLVVSEQTTGLSQINFKKHSSALVKEYIKVNSLAGNATMVVTTIRRGDEADRARDAYQNKSVKEIMKEYQKFYAAYFKDIAADSLKYVDDERTGDFTTTEYYSIPNIWEQDGDSRKISFTPFCIASTFTRPEEVTRTMPFTLSYPSNITEEIIVEMPEDWKVTEDELELANDNFKFRSRFYRSGNKIYLSANYESLKDFTSVEETDRYLSDVAHFDDNSNFEISYSASSVVVHETMKTGNKVQIAILALAAIIGGAIWWRKKRNLHERY
jgi:hypothetical protein